MSDGDTRMSVACALTAAGDVPDASKWKEYQVRDQVVRILPFEVASGRVGQAKHKPTCGLEGWAVIDVPWQMPQK